MAEASERRRRAGWLSGLQIAVVALAGYVLGSFFPAGYVNYLIRSQLFPETLGYKAPPFDRTKLAGATRVSPESLLATLDENPMLFAQRFEGKPVLINGRVEHFLDTGIGDGRLTITLHTENDFDGIFLSFDEPRNPSVVALRKERDVRAACMVSSSSGSNIHLEHCEVKGEADA